MFKHSAQANIGSQLTVAVVLLLCFGTVLQLLGTSVVEAKGVHVTLAAPWTETPFLQEGCEWLAIRDINHDGFYECLEDIWRYIEPLQNNNNNNNNSSSSSSSSMGGGALTLTQKSQYEMLFNIMESRKRSSNQVAILKMKLAARVYSPVVEAHWVLARTAMRLAGGCSTQGKPFVMIFGNAICNENAFEKILKDLVMHNSSKSYEKENNEEVKKETMTLFSKLDHIHPESKGPIIVILYGLVGDQQTKRLFNIVKPYLHMIRFAFRHLPVTGGMWGNPLFVQGYGVTVDLKNVEYKVIDKKNTETEQQEKKSAEEEEGKDTETIGGFDLHVLKQRYPKLTKQLNSFGEYLAEAIDKEEVKVDFHMWETQHMGVEAVKQVMNAAEDKRLGVLLNILTDFPLHASKLSKMGTSTNEMIDSEIQEGIAQLATTLQPGLSVAFLNGRHIPMQELDLFSILEKLEADDRVLESLTQILTSYHIPSPSTGDGFLSVEPTLMITTLHWIRETVQKRLASQGVNVKKPTSRIWFPQKSILWTNDVENDPIYFSLPSDLNSILQVGFTGVPVIPKRNVLNLVGIVDPTTSTGQQAIITLIKLVTQGQPLRAGIAIVDPHWVPELRTSSMGSKDDDVETTEKSSTSDIVMMIAATLWELLRDDLNNLYQVITFMSDLRQFVSTGETITDAHVHRLAGNILIGADKRSLLEITADLNFNKYYHEMQETIHNSRFKEYPTILINGNIFTGDVVTALRKGLMTELNYVRGLVKNEKLKNTDEDMYESIMKSSGATSRYFRALYEDEIYVNWASKSIIDFLQYRSFLLPLSNTEEEVPLLSTVLSFQTPITPRSLEALLKTTEQLYQCKDEMQKCRFIRHTFAICGNEKDTKRRTLAVDLERLLLNEKGMDESRRLEFMREFLLKVVPKSSKFDLNDPDVYEKFLVNAHFSSGVEKILANTALTSDTLLQQEEQRKLVDGFCKQMRGGSLTSITDEVEDEESIYYYVNGRRFTYSNEFTSSDLEEAALRELPFAEIVWGVIEGIQFEKMNKYLHKNNLNNPFYASKVSAITAVLKSSFIHSGDTAEENQLLPAAPGPISFIVNPISGKQPRHRFTVVLDPISQQSQILVSLCDYIVRSPIDASCTVYLNPSQHSGKLMRNFYHYVGDVNVSFDNTGRVIPPAAIFRRLPSKHLLTLGVEEPEGWTVFPMEAQYDLDNIILASLPRVSEYLYATYRINSILITGSAKESGESMPPRGLPLMIRSLRNSSSPNSITRDTLVMANLGYFQLQGAPGVWYLSVQPGGIAKSFYISKVKGVGMNYVEGKHDKDMFNYSRGQSIPIVVSSFTGEFLKLEVAKAPGEENAQIEDLVEASAVHIKWPPRGPNTKRPERPTLNIFSVASGHLYERFLRMMMISVMNTSSDVHGPNTTRIKFWLIENFLSPQFKELVPLLAEHYGFDVGFVTYRWPWWLNKQTEKQRTIWGYKILFLDVLFPLDVERIIFVDADQTVQADLHELYNMDIGDAPMAYTPFCREYPNDATKNFRFWDQGFWLRHLSGRPYHISAIYLVDVRRLRSIAGGDKYRMMYSQLSRDPNSLANLDQDLPNFMQDQVPIYSLPEEWLWCETWCSGESKTRAKTIDLCNNPLTKIPKLENAKRIINGWEEIDAGLENISEKLRQAYRAKHQAKVS